MNDQLFDHPVFVREGKALIREIASVGDAIDFLEDWPDHRRDLAHETLLKACSAVMAGEKPVHAVERGIRRFAKRAGILEDAISVMPWQTPATPRSGALPA